MFYFAFNDTYAVVQNEDQAQKFAEAGWEPITREQFREGWRKKDAAAMEGIAVEDAAEHDREARSHIKGALPGKVYPVKEPGV